MNGKNKCRALKEIRRQIAEKNDIAYVVSECSYQGECKGTCPKCESELRYLERELEKRRKLGKAIAVAGISLGVLGTTTACGPDQIIEKVRNPILEQQGELEGDVEYIPNPIETESRLTEEEPLVDDIETEVPEIETTENDTEDIPVLEGDMQFVGE